MTAEAQTVVLLVALAFNFVATIVGGVALLWSVWRWFSRFEQDVLQRITRVETELRQLMRSRGCQPREETPPMPSAPSWP